MHFSCVFVVNCVFGKQKGNENAVVEESCKKLFG